MTNTKDFLTEAHEKISTVEHNVKEIDGASRSLAVHFSEEPSKFILSECFSIFSDLLQKIEMARKENVVRQKQEERMAKLAAEKERQVKDGPVGKLRTSTITSKEEEVCVVDRLLEDIRRGEFKLNKARN